MTELEELIILLAANVTIVTEQAQPEGNALGDRAAELLDKIKPDWREWHNTFRKSK